MQILGSISAIVCAYGTVSCSTDSQLVNVLLYLLLTLVKAAVAARKSSSDLWFRRSNRPLSGRLDRLFLGTTVTPSSSREVRSAGLVAVLFGI